MMTKELNKLMDYIDNMTPEEYAKLYDKHIEKLKAAKPKDWEIAFPQKTMAEQYSKLINRLGRWDYRIIEVRPDYYRFDFEDNLFIEDYNFLKELKDLVHSYYIRTIYTRTDDNHYFKFEDSQSASLFYDILSNNGYPVHNSFNDNILSDIDISLAFISQRELNLINYIKKEIQNKRLKYYYEA